MRAFLGAIPLAFFLMTEISTAGSIDYITIDSSIGSGTVSNNYDSLTGLSQHVGTCFIGPPAVTGPCGSISSSPANTPGLTSGTVGIANGVSYDPQNGVTGFGAASALADLAMGVIGAAVSAPQCSPATALCSDQGTASARMQDALTFTNTTGQTVDILVTWTFDGTVVPTAISPGSPVYTLTSDFCLATGSTCAFGGNPNEFQFNDSTGSITNAMPSSGWVSSSLIPGGNSTSESFQGLFAIPTGMTTENLLASLFVGCTMANCDFIHTGTLDLGPLPSGVSFTSASGVLLTQAAETPEPSSMLLILTGVVAILWRVKGLRFGHAPRYRA
jgi:hypothetical protein